MVRYVTSYALSYPGTCLFRPRAPSVRIALRHEGRVDARMAVWPMAGWLTIEDWQKVAQKAVALSTFRAYLLARQQHKAGATISRNQVSKYGRHRATAITPCNEKKIFLATVHADR